MKLLLTSFQGHGTGHGMNDFSQQTPELCSITQCNKTLQFSPLSPWPQGLPAVAVNQMVFAGFDQKLVFNHQLPLLDQPQNSEQQQQIAQLFRSLYFELTFPEMARLIEKASVLEWFPLSLVISSFGWQASEHFFKVAEALRQTPMEFQNWCSEKKLNPQDLSPLLSAKGLDLDGAMQDLILLRLSKSSGAQALELIIELMLMGQTAQSLRADSLSTNTAKTAETWLENLKQLRYPNTFASDQSEQEKMKNLPWPGTSQAKWIRQGDKAGIELKLFVSQPSDLKKYLQSLSHIQDLLSQSDTKH